MVKCLGDLHERHTTSFVIAIENFDLENIYNGEFEEKQNPLNHIDMDIQANIVEAYEVGCFQLPAYKEEVLDGIYHIIMVDSEEFHSLDGG